MTKLNITKNVAKEGRRNTPARALVHEVVRELAGFAPYEKRAMELMKVDTISCNKRAFKLIKKRLGKHSHAKVKREELRNAVVAMKRHN